MSDVTGGTAGAPAGGQGAPATTTSGGSAPAPATGNASAPPNANGGTPPETTPKAGGDGTVLGADDTGAGTKDGQPGAPEGQKAGADIEVKLPEGAFVDEKLFNGFKSLAKEMNLTSEQAQKLMDLQFETSAAAAKAADDAYGKMKSDWQKQAKEDKEFGGPKFDASVKQARAAIAKFGTPEFKKFLNEFGVGDHPELIRFMVKVGSMLREDKVSSTTSAGKAASSGPSEEDILRARYPSMYT